MDTLDARETLRALEQQKLRSNFIIRRENLKNVSKLYKGISVSEKAIKSRLSKVEYHLSDIGSNPMCLKLTKTESLASNLENQLFQQYLSDQSDSMDLCLEEEESSNISKKKKERKPKKKSTNTPSDNISIVVENPQNLRPPIIDSEEVPEIERKKRKDPPVVDLTEESELIQQLKVKIMTQLGNEEFAVFVRTTNGDSRICEHVSL